MSASVLRQALDATMAEQGCSMGDLTVLAPQNDPFRVDTPARHRDGAWLADTAAELGLGHRKIHLRGLHYMLSVPGLPKPDGTPYRNSDADWLWLSGDAGKAARWLGYIPFDQIVDQRNDPPTIRVFEAPSPASFVSAGVHLAIPDADEIMPEVEVVGFEGVQPFKLVFFGEKSSLADVLGSVAQERHADLYLPKGEISDTLLHTMAGIGAEDGRPMVVFCFSDADPSGWQMPISIARKLQAFKASLFPELEFEVRRAALTPHQVREYGLPSTPLKATESRADKWQAAMGVAQTEIDALAALHPELLEQIALDATAPYFDATLDHRVRSARSAWLHAAQAELDAQLDLERLDRIRDQAGERLAAVRGEIVAINSSLRAEIPRVEFPAFAIPTAHVEGEGHGLPLVDSRWSFGHQCRELIASKQYRANGVHQ